MYNEGGLRKMSVMGDLNAEHERLMEILSGLIADEALLREVFQRFVSFFRFYKKVMANGTSEEKEEAQRKMISLRRKLKEENVKGKEKSGLSDDEISNLAQDPRNFTPEQWSLLQEVQNQLASEGGVYQVSRNKPAVNPFQVNVNQVHLDNKGSSSSQNQESENKGEGKGEDIDKSHWIKS